MDLQFRDLIRPLYRVICNAFRVLVWVYVFCFCLLMLGLHLWGQRNLTTAALMYLPPLLWVAPTLFLVFIAPLFNWKSLFPLLLLVAWFFWGHLDYQLFAAPPADTSKAAGGGLRLLTWNRGQGKAASLQNWVAALKPDLVSLQESPGASYYQGKTGYLDFPHVAETGELILLSRWPIRQTESIATVSSHHGAATRPIASRFVIDFPGRPVVVYNVHLPSPRDALMSYGRGAFLWGIIGFPGSPWESKKLQYQKFWDDQIDAAHQIAERARAEKDPVLVLGDFNTPAYGPIYREFSDFLTDSHRAVGQGCGFTFPGDTRNPVALFRPWLRLDQVFGSSHWRFHSSSPQRARSQHLPVFVELTLEKK